MPVPQNSQIPQLNPLRTNTSLLQESNNAVIVRDVRARGTSKRDIRHLGDIGQLIWRRSALQQAGSVTGCVSADGDRVERTAIVDGRRIVERDVRKAPRACRGAADGGDGGVADVGFEGDVAGFDVQVAENEVGTAVGHEEWINAADAVRDGESRTDYAEEGAASALHCGFLDGEVGGYGKEGGHEGVEVGVALGTGLRRKDV